MKGTSKVVMGATIVMVVSVALVLGLVLILLAELYCSLFLRRHFRKNSFSIHKSRFSLTNDPSTPQQNDVASVLSSLGGFYSQGVLQVPRNMLFPPNSNGDLEKQNSQEIQAEVPTDAQVVGHLYSSEKLQHEEQFIYISNPIYNNSKVDTPFVTPDTSPSRLDERIESCGEDEDEEEEEEDETPPLTPMKKLPAEGCSVSLRDARSLCTTGSDSNSNNECITASSLGSPSTSPSW